MCTRCVRRGSLLTPPHRAPFSAPHDRHPLLSARAQVFKIILARVFDLKCNIPKIVQVGEPILEY